MEYFMPPKVSVIVPNYNHSKFLEKRIQSILNQTVQDFELILLDDFSTDNSIDIIEKYRTHPKVSAVIINSSNSGNTFRQWEKGINCAQGKYIWIAESDDWCETNLLEYLLEGIEANPGCVLSYCQSYAVKDENEVLWQSHHHLLQDNLDGTSYVKKYMITNNSIFNASMVLWRKECFQRISKDFTSYKFCGDWLFWIELSLMGNVSISGRILNYFRNHTNDVSSAAESSGLGIIETARLLNWLYQKKLITDLQYSKQYKILHRDYWISRARYSHEYSRIIKELLYHPQSPTLSAFKLRLSSLWYQLRSR